MPAPAVIPAPIAYINAAAVKGFVVECGVLGSFFQFAGISSLLCLDGADAVRRLAFIGRPMLLSEELNITHATHVPAARRYHCEENSVFKAAASG